MGIFGAHVELRKNMSPHAIQGKQITGKECVA